MDFMTADYVVRQLVSLLSAQELTTLAITCVEWKEAVLAALEPRTKDISGGLESKPVPCKISLLLAAKFIAVSKSETRPGIPEPPTW